MTSETNKERLLRWLIAAACLVAGLLFAWAFKSYFPAGAGALAALAFGKEWKYPGDC